MDIAKKITDFIRLEDGNIGQKAAVTTGALLATSVLGAVLLAPTATAGNHCDGHSNYTHCHSNTSAGTYNFGCHTNDC